MPPGSAIGCRWLPATKFIGPATNCPMPSRGGQVREGQIFAEGHEMDLVDGVDDLAPVVDGDDRIVVERLRRRAAASVADRAGHQHLARLQHLADGRPARRAAR